MLVGHYVAAFAGKAFEPRAPLWLLFLAAQFVDVIWTLLVLAGIERVALDPTLPSNPLDLQYMPYTHSLVAAAAWSLAAVFAVRAFGFARSSTRVAVVVGLVAFSHWGLDFVSHRPDLPLYGDTLKVGLGLWGHPTAAFVTELLLVVAGMGLYLRASALPRRRCQRVLALAAVLVALQTMASTGPTPTAVEAVVGPALVAFLALAWLARWVESKGSEA